MILLHVLCHRVVSWSGKVTEITLETLEIQVNRVDMKSEVVLAASCRIIAPFTDKGLARPLRLVAHLVVF